MYGMQVLYCTAKGLVKNLASSYHRYITLKLVKDELLPLVNKEQGKSCSGTRDSQVVK